MERPADDIFLINDLSILQSPVPKHLFLGRSSDASSSSFFLGNTSNGSAANGHSSNKETPKAHPQNKMGTNDENKTKKKNIVVDKSPSTKQCSDTGTLEKRKVGRPKGSTKGAKTGKLITKEATSTRRLPPNTTTTTTSRVDPADRHSPSSALVQSLSVTNDSKETPKVITLTNWSLATVPNSPKLTGVSLEERSLWVVLVGKRPDMAEAWHSSIVTERIVKNHIKTGSGKSLYILDPPMNIEEMQSNGFSESFINAFKVGFPDNWKALLMSELDRLGRTITKYKTKKPTQQQQQQQQQPDTSNNSTKKDSEPKEVVKRGRGRPRKYPKETVEQNSPPTQPPSSKKRREQSTSLEDNVTKNIHLENHEMVVVVAEDATEHSIQEQSKKRGPGRPEKLLTTKAPPGEDKVIEPSPPIDAPKRGRGRPRKIPVNQEPLPSVSEPLIPESPKRSPPAVLSARRRHSGGSTVKWGWGGRALIRSEGGDKR